MGDVSESIREIKKSNFGRVILNITLVIFLIAFLTLFIRHVIKDYKGQYSNFLWGAHEVNKECPIRDTIFVQKESINQPLKIENKQSSAPAIVQKNKNGKNEVNQNSGINMGTIGGTNNTVENNFNVERQLTQDDKNEFENFILKLKRENVPYSDTINLSISQNSNGQKLFTQLHKYLLSKGFYVIQGSLMTLNPLEGIEIKVMGRDINIYIGSLN
jgi:hypothetical protein